MQIVQLSSDELVQTLRRSQLPTILVEGRDDMTIYRWLEAWNVQERIDVMPCGGRVRLLEVFSRRAEFEHTPCVFLADQDMWLFSAIPVEYREIIFTRGYSIENDILDDFPLLLNLLSATEKTEFDSLCDALAAWFAFEVEQFRRSLEFRVDIHPNRLVPLGSTTFDEASISPRNFRKPNKRLVRSIRNSFFLKFRGKSLVDLFVRILNAPGRTSKYSRHNILEMSSKNDSSKHKKRLIRLINQKINSQI